MKALALTLPVLFAVSTALPAAETGPHWIWAGESRGGTHYFRHLIELPAPPQRAQVRGAGDFCDLTVYLNGREIASIPAYGPIFEADLARHFQPGENTLAVRARSVPGPTAFFLQGKIELADGQMVTWSTDVSWRSSKLLHPNWQTRPLSKEWRRAVSFGPVSSQPWLLSGNDIGISPLDNYEQWKQALNAGPATDPASFMTLPGFEIELLRSAAPEEGSWVGMEFDPQGRLIVAKEKKGLLRFTLPRSPAEAPLVEIINDTLEECRGLLFLGNDLYVNANRSKGFYRLRDTDGDDQFDELQMLVQTRSGGHGRNDLALGPDGRIYLIHGDDVDLPPGTLDLTPPVVTGLFPGEKLTHGHLIRTTPDAKRWEVLARGLRNPFGVDFNRDGEPFTYDADAEHDMGAPWYRPTHVRHLVSGGDYGWRRVTGQWPPYFVDHVDEPPATLVTGKGSPTAVKFGTRSSFPPLYQRALFILDWAYGRILAVHLAPRGASYVARAETFLRGRPLNVTDLDFGPEGAMYFVTGGRNTQSALYRLRYTGPKIEAPSVTIQDGARAEHAGEARHLRRQLESFHGRDEAQAIDTAWPLLNHADPWIAHAARVAVEHQPLSAWTQRALSETNVSSAVPALMALARIGPDAVLAPILQRLNAIAWPELSNEQKRVVLRTCEICLSRLDAPETALLAGLISRLETLFPDETAEVNFELAKLLVQLEAPSAVRKTIVLLTAAASQEQKLHALFLLRNVRAGWTEADRGRYFRALAQTESFSGGAGLPKFLAQIKAEALASLPDELCSEFAALLDTGQSAAGAITLPEEARAFVKDWSVTELLDSLKEAGQGRNFERGRKMYAAAMCVACHQLGREGRAFGPDLTDVANRFSRRDLLEAIISPSLVISETYRNVTVRLKDGETITGRVALEGDYRLPVLRIAPDALAPEKLLEIPKEQIVNYAESPVSSMPEGLLNSLSREEILDLLAYIEAGGDPHHRNFR